VRLTLFLCMYVCVCVFSLLFSLKHYLGISSVFIFCPFRVYCKKIGFWIGVSEQRENSIGWHYIFAVMLRWRQCVSINFVENCIKWFVVVITVASVVDLRKNLVRIDRFLYRIAFVWFVVVVVCLLIFFFHMHTNDWLELVLHFKRVFLFC